MPHYCSVSWCKNNNKKGYRLFKIPADPERQQKWLSLISRPHLSYDARVCECHFSNAQFETARMDGRKLLKPFAFPDLLCTTGSKSKRKPAEATIHMPFKLLRGTENQCAESSGLSGSSNEFFFKPPKIEILENVCSDSSDPLMNDSNDEELDEELMESLENGERCVSENMKKAIKSLSRKCRLYEKKLKQREPTNLEGIFNIDQLQFLGTEKCEEMMWLDDTITKGLKLYMACGTVGYTEILRQNLPYPSIRTLQHHLRNLK